MGRELKRVPLTFSWPINEIWTGYLNPWYEKPHRDPCPHCDGMGATNGSKRLDDLIRLLMLSGDDGRRARSHPYFDRMEGLHYSQGKIPSKDLAELTKRLAGREPSFLGHDCSDQWSARRKILKAAGIRSKHWGDCPMCKGTGNYFHSEEARRKYATWRRREPPKGVGYQLWETTTEGSPISPVFKTPELLANWLASNSTGRTPGLREDWLRFIRGPGWAPTFVVENGVVKTAPAI